MSLTCSGWKLFIFLKPQFPYPRNGASSSNYFRVVEGIKLKMSSIQLNISWLPENLCTELLGSPRMGVTLFQWRMDIMKGREKQRNTHTHTHRRGGEKEKCNKFKLFRQLVQRNVNQGMMEVPGQANKPVKGAEQVTVFGRCDYALHSTLATKYHYTQQHQEMPLFGVEQKQFKMQLLPLCTSEINPCFELLFSPLHCLSGLSLIGLDWNHGKPLIKMVNNINNSKGDRKASLLFLMG